MNVSNAVKTAYKNNSAAKILTISFPDINYTVPQDEVYYESMELNEAIFDGDSFEAVGCIASQFIISIRNTGMNLKGTKIVVTMSLYGIEDSEIPLFYGYVDSVDKEAQKKMQKITAYDALYSKGNIDVASWYKNLQFPLSLKSLRNSLFSYIGITQRSITLPCDNVQINKEYTPNTLPAIDVIKALCQINGCFGIIGRTGNFIYRYLDMEETPESVNYYRNMDYKDYTITPVDKLIIRQNKEDTGVYAGSGTNVYIIQGNMFTYNLSNSTLESIAVQVFLRLHEISYIPFEASNNGYPWVEVGDNCKLNYSVYDFEQSTSSQQVYSDVTVVAFKRSMKGIQNLVDTYSAEGKELQQEFISDLSRELDILQQTVENLVNGMSTEITTYRNASVITIGNGKTATIADLVYDANKGNTIIFHEEADLQVTAVESLTNGVYTEGDVTGTVRYYVNGTRLPTHLSQGVFSQGKHILNLMQFWQSGSVEKSRFQAKLTVNGGSVKIAKLRAQAYITVKQSDYKDAAIEVTKMPKKIIYSPGEQIDYTGLVISKVYYDETVPSEIVTSQCSLTPSSGSTVTVTDMIDVLVTYTETTELGELVTYETTFQLSTLYLVSISVEDEPDDTEYFVGENLDLDGIKVTADYSDGTTKDVTADCTYSPANGYTFVASSEGQIQITYEENGVTKNTNTYVSVQDVELESIEITTPPDKVKYNVQETIDLTGIVVTAHFNNGNDVDITSQCTFDPADGDDATSDMTQITASYTYEGTTMEDSVDIEVSEGEANLKYFTYETDDVRKIIWLTGFNQEEIESDNLRLLKVPSSVVDEHGVRWTVGYKNDDSEQ